MQIILFFALFIAILAILFAVQNNELTQVSFFVWDFEGSLALVLLIAMAAGALISFLVSLPTNLRVRWTVRNQRKKITELEMNLDESRQELEEIRERLEPVETEKSFPQPGPEKSLAPGGTTEDISEIEDTAEESLPENDLEGVDPSEA